jgi:hypothetical protein
MQISNRLHVLEILSRRDVMGIETQSPGGGPGHLGVRVNADLLWGILSLQAVSSYIVDISPLEKEAFEVFTA